eukprot:166806_1
MEIKYFRINNIITLIKCNEIHLVIISYIIAKNINQTTRKPFHVSNVKKLFDGNKINGNKLSKMTCNEFIDIAKSYKKINGKQLFEEINLHFQNTMETTELKSDEVSISIGPNWHIISNLLYKHQFFLEEDNTNLLNEDNRYLRIETLFTEYCEQYKVDLECFTNDLCSAYYNDDDDKYMFYEILTTHFRFPLETR